jgi:hypothetical protein
MDSDEAAHSRVAHALGRLGFDVVKRGEHGDCTAARVRRAQRTRIRCSRAPVVQARVLPRACRAGTWTLRAVSGAGGDRRAPVGAAMAI